jgi:hypothetical protein
MPNRFRSEYLPRCHREGKPVGGKVASNEVEATLDPADGGPVAMRLQSQRTEDFVHQHHGAALS